MRQYRPEEYCSEQDAALAALARDLLKVLRQTQKSFTHSTLRLAKPDLAELAEVLVEFGEDIHNHVGLWEAYEEYNLEFFGDRLPLTPITQDAPGITVDRIRHLLAVLYPELIPGLIVCARDRDLQDIADAAHRFLTAAFASRPKESGVKALLEEPNDYGWEIKRKLIWLGTKSYLFRLMFRNYLARENRGEWDIGHVDDFICQACTRWSGLGAIDILAGVLHVSAQDREDLRSWYQRHASFYEIKTANHKHLDVLNVINDRPYRIRVDMPGHPFRPGHLVFGSLVPWRGEWYWSGQQEKWDSMAGMKVEDLRDKMKQSSSQLVCRFCKEYEARVRERAKALHEAALAYHGKDLVVYTDGAAMAADWQKEMELNWQSCSPEQVKAIVERHGLSEGRPAIRIPPRLQKHKNGLGVFLHPVEGKEIMIEFHSLVDGLKKRRGIGLTEDQEDAIQHFVTMDSLSPEFVLRVVGEYGTESIRAVFRIPQDAPDYWLEYLLRQHKGRYYRTRYPSVALV